MLNNEAHFLYNGIPARNFAGLMELYECNYIRLRNLLPDLDTINTTVVSRVTGVLDLHLKIIERCKFTTTLNLTYMFHDDEGSFPAPDMQVRMYHDAQVGEVIACGRRRGERHAVYNRRFPRYSLSEKWHMNRVLQKRLGFCLMQGHRFVEGAVLLPAETAPTAVRKSAVDLES